MWHLLAVLAVGIGVAASASFPEASIEDFIDAEMPASGLPGLAYAGVADDGIGPVGARGVVTSGTDDVTPDTPFVIGSISKSFTALAVMQLVEAGEVDLDGEVSRYLDEFACQLAGDVTVRQLLSHTSGFSTLQGNASHAQTTGGQDALERWVDQVAKLTPAYQPDSRSRCAQSVPRRQLETDQQREIRCKWPTLPRLCS